MRDDTVTENGSKHHDTLEGLAPAQPDDTVAIRQLAIAHIERVRRFKRDLTIFVVGGIGLTCVWAVTEYSNSGGWPDHLSENGQPGDWNPWIFWALLVWGFLVLLDGVRAYFRRPTTEAEIEREVDRIRSRR